MSYDYTELKAKLEKIEWSNYWIAGVAAIGATVFTNPLEVGKKTYLHFQ